MKKTRKGFTIVELIIVIAVVAVLTAILVPTFIHLTKKANEAADHSLVTNLNKALAMREAEEGDKGKNNTMYDCVMDLEKEGYKLPQLVTRSDEDLVWSQQTNRFFLSVDYKEAEHGGKYNCWHIYEQMPETQEWAIYPNEEKWTATDVENLKVGFDAGKAEVKSVLYNGEAGYTVSIRTTKGSLTVEAPEDSVKHYGVLDSLTIKAIKGKSYHEHGLVRGGAVISQGHIEIEEGAEVPQVLVQNATGAVTVTANEPTIVVADSASENQTSVVANSEEVYVSGVPAGNVTGSESSSVVRAQDVTSNETLASALLAGGFYRVANDFTVSSLVTVPAGKTAVIDFNGKTITYSGNWLWENHGTLTVTDSGANGGITCGKGAIDNYGSLVVNGGKFTTSISQSGSGIYNEVGCNMTINNATIEATHFAIVNEGTAVINGGKFNSTSSSANGAWAYCISSGFSANASITINGGTFTGIQGAIAINGGKGVINDVNASTKEGDSYSYYALYIAGEYGPAEANVYGGTYVGGYRNAAHIGNSNKGGDGGIGAPAYVNIYGGKFIGHGTEKAVNVSFASDGFGIGQAFMYGGTYSTQPESKYIGAGLSAVKNSDGTYTIK